MNAKYGLLSVFLGDNEEEILSYSIYLLDFKVDAHDDQVVGSLFTY